VAEEKELEALISRISTKALGDRASKLRGGVPCSVPELRYDRATRTSVMGGMNYHVPIKFEDGIEWIARIRRFNASSPPPVVRDYILQSEVATMKFLERVDVPTPRIYDFALGGEANPVGVGYILMEKLPGKSLRWSLASEDQRTTVLSGVADAFIELHKHPLPQMGALQLEPGAGAIGQFARESLLDLENSHLAGLGPFTSVEEYHTSSIRLILDHILRKEKYTSQPVDAYLIHRFLLDVVSKVSPTLHDQKSQFYLKHADDKGDHILVDEDYNITGIIDWEWAHTAPFELAFNSPIACLPVGDFYDGANSLGEDEITLVRLLTDKGREDLAAAVRKGRVQHRFAFCCGYNLDADWQGFLGLFRGLRDAIGVDAGMDWDEWKRTALQRYEADEGLMTLLRRQE
jgi:hypothetical protein